MPEPQFQEFTDADQVWPGDRPNNSRSPTKKKPPAKGGRSSPSGSGRGSPSGSGRKSPSSSGRRSPSAGSSRRGTPEPVSQQSSRGSLGSGPSVVDPLEGMSLHDIQEELIRRGLAADHKEAKKLSQEQAASQLRAALEQDMMLAYCLQLATTDLPDRAYADARDRLINRLKVSDGAGSATFFFSSCPAGRCSVRHRAHMFLICALPHTRWSAMQVPDAVRTVVAHAETDAEFAFIQRDPVPPKVGPMTFLQPFLLYSPPEHVPGLHLGPHRAAGRPMAATTSRLPHRSTRWRAGQCRCARSGAQ